MATTSYEVKSDVRRELFEVFVKAVGTGAKVPVTKENATSISLLAKKFLA
jgi:PHD/YefM family antitoxin component YafN of YafNO toxin-antitoxin module